MTTQPKKFKLIQLERALIYAFLIILLLICLIPFMMMIVNATRSASDINSGFTLKPSNQFMTNYNQILALANVSLMTGIRNSTIIAVLSTILTAYFSTLTAYGFEFYEFKGKKFFFGIILIMMMVPGQLGILGFYDLNVKLKLLDTFVPLIIPAVANIFGVFFIRQYLASVIHMSLIEAARIDGCKEITIFHQIVFPLALPATATITIMGFIGAWNNYMGPLLIIKTPAKRTLPLLIGSLLGSRVIQNNYGAMYAALAISVFPILCIFALFSRYIISGISAGGVKE